MRILPMRLLWSSRRAATGYSRKFMFGHPLTGNPQRTRATGRLAMDSPKAEAMRMFCEEHAAAVLRYAFELTRNQICAENVVQETLRRAGRHPEVVGDTWGSARAWLFTTARNMIIHESHGAQLRLRVVSSDGSGAPQAAGPDAGKSALKRMLVGDAMAQLSAEHRAVIRRSYYGDRTTDQIAADLQIPEASVKLRLHDALRALRQMLQEMGVVE